MRDRQAQRPPEERGDGEPVGQRADHRGLGRRADVADPARRRRRPRPSGRAGRSPPRPAGARWPASSSGAGRGPCRWGAPTPRPTSTATRGAVPAGEPAGCARAGRCVRSARLHSACRPARDGWLWPGPVSSDDRPRPRRWVRLRGEGEVPPRAPHLRTLLHVARKPWARPTCGEKVRSVLPGGPRRGPTVRGTRGQSRAATCARRPLRGGGRPRARRRRRRTAATIGPTGDGR